MIDPQALKDLIATWRDEAKFGRSTLDTLHAAIGPSAYSGQMATILRAERDAYDLEALLSASLSDQTPDRYSMHVDVRHHEMSDRDGEPFVVARPDPAGEWVRAAPANQEPAPR